MIGVVRAAQNRQRQLLTTATVGTTAGAQSYTFPVGTQYADIETYGGGGGGGYFKSGTQAAAYKGATGGVGGISESLSVQDIERTVPSTLVNSTTHSPVRSSSDSCSRVCVVIQLL